MEFTCIKCEFKFNKMSYDLDERMCFECLYADDDQITSKDILDASAEAKDEEWQFFSHTKSVFDFKIKKKEKSK